MKGIRDEGSLAKALEAERIAKEAAADADKAARLAGAGPAELSRTRGDYGSVSSLRRYWTFSDLDRAELDLSDIAPAPGDRRPRKRGAPVHQGRRAELDGVQIYETTDAVVRLKRNIDERPRPDRHRPALWRRRPAWPPASPCCSTTALYDAARTSRASWPAPRVSPRRI